MAELEIDAEADLREQQRALIRVLRAIAAGGGLQSVLDEIVDASTVLGGGEHARIYLLEGTTLRAVANHGATEGFDYDLAHPHLIERGSLAGRTALERAPIQIPDVLEDPEYTYQGSTVAFRAGFGVPLLLDETLMGSLVVVRSEPGRFADDKVELVKAFADQAAIAIRSARLLETVERQLSQQRAVGAVMRSVARSQGLQAVLDDIVQSATLLSGVENGRLFLLKDDLLYAAANYGSDENFEYDQQHPHAIDRSTLTGRAALAREPVHIPDVLEDPEYTYAGDGSELPYRSGVTVPVLLEEELIGAFGIVSDQANAFTDEHIELLQTFADQAAIAIANARLLDAVERQLEQQRAISDVLAAVARAEGLESVLHALIEAACRLCEAQFGEVYLVDGDLLRLAVGHGGPPELYEYERMHPHPIHGERRSVNGRVILARDVVQIPDIRQDPEYDWEAALTSGIRALLGAPLIVEGNLVGVFNIVRTEPEAFSDDQIDLLRTFADQAAIAVANARLMEAVERQRTELARFVSPQVAELLSSDEGERMLAGHRAYVTSMFFDLRGFTSFTELAEPEELFEVLGEYHLALGSLIPQFEGTLEHFAGDGLMVFFNDPVPVENHELKAVRLALAAQERFEQLAASWRKRGHELGLGIGIAAGYATLGRIGFEGRYDYGVLGTVTNLAARLSDRAAPGQILVSQRLYAAVEDAVELAPGGELELKGFGRPVPAYEILGLKA